MTTREAIASFIREHYQPALEWDYPNTVDWVGWHLSHGHVILAKNDDETVCGLTVCRPVMKPQDAEEWYETDPEGSCIFVDLVIALRKTALQALVLGALKRFGQRDFIAWRRPPFHVIEFHDANRFTRIALREGKQVYGIRK